MKCYYFPMKETLNKNECYNARIEGYSSDASGICHIGGMTVFVPHVLSGETVRVRIVKVLSSYAYGRAEEVLEPSPEWVVPICPNYYRCGGCSTQHMTYKEELRFKSEVVRDCLRHIAHQAVPAVAVAGSEFECRYRNKATFSFSNRNGKRTDFCPPAPKRKGSFPSRPSVEAVAFWSLPEKQKQLLPARTGRSCFAVLITPSGGHFVKPIS